MIFKIDEDTARAIDEEALKVFPGLAIEPEKPSDSPGTFHPNYFMHVGTIGPREIPKEKNQITVGLDGLEVGRFLAI
jgi:hypothetical protein